jgi:hypothetical protein
MSTEIEINPNPTPTPAQPAVFDPQDAVTYAYDAVIWHNSDSVAHLPAPSAANPNGWFSDELAPGDTSDTITPGPNTTPSEPYTVNYVCANHPEEKGTITVYPQQ